MASIEDDSLPASAQVQDSAEEGKPLLSIIGRPDSYLTDVEDCLKDKDGNVDLDEKNKYGNTALMIACYNGKKELVEFLLRKGADPNHTNEDGDTALHKACDYALYDDEVQSIVSQVVENDERDEATKEGHSEDPSHGDDKNEDATQRSISNVDQKIVEMVELLLEYKATFQLNHNGLHPVDVAALEGRDRAVAYFLLKNLLSKSEEIKALEFLGLALAIDNKCRNAYLVLVKAMKKRHADPDNPVSKDFTSELEGFLGQKECQNLEELKALKTSKHGIVIEAVLTGDRILPQRMKEYHLYERLIHYGSGLLYHRKTMDQGFGILTGCLQLEQKGWVYLNSILMSLRCCVEEAATKRDMFRIMPQFLSDVCKVLKAYVNVFQGVSCANLKGNVKDIVTNLSLMLFYVTDKYEGLEVTDDFLVPITEMIDVIWSRIPKPEVTGNGMIYPTVSVCHYLLLHVVHEFCNNYFFGGSEYTCYRFKRLIANLLLVEGALDVDCLGNTMMHTVMILVRSSRLDMVVDLTNLLIRHGCPTSTKNKKGETPEFIAKDEAAYWTDPEDSAMDEVYRLLKGPTEVFPLQELAARAILYHRIPYDKIPPLLKKVINDSILEDEVTGLEISSDSDSDSSLCVIS